MTLAGALNYKEEKKGSKQTVCECLNTKHKSCVQDRGHLVFLQVQVVHAVAMGVCRPRAEV